MATNLQPFKIVGRIQTYSHFETKLLLGVLLISLVSCTGGEITIKNSIPLASTSSTPTGGSTPPSTPPPSGPATAINWTSVKQVIDGFGASTAFSGTPLTATQADLFFSPTKGIGLSLLRTEVPDDGSCQSVSQACAGEISDMQMASARGAKVWSTPWSPPAGMKSNNSLTNGGSLLSSSYGSYASYLANYVKSVSTYGNGISLYALSIQNEPEENVSYDSAIWTGQNFHDFVLNNLGPAMVNSSTQIIMPEPAGFGDLANMADATLNDANAAAYVGIVAFHGYDNPTPTGFPLAQNMGKRLWQTEDSGGNGFGPTLCGGCWDPSMNDALMWANIINGWMVNANLNAWHYWWAINLGNTDNEGLVYVDGVTTSKRLYAIGNFSKFVRPGFYRIDATYSPQSGVTISAYKNPSTGDFAVVAINQNTTNTNQIFTLTGFTTTTVTPWITSASSNLVSQASITTGESWFQYNLPAQSVVTFIGKSN